MAVQIHPTRQQSPAFALHRSTHFVRPYGGTLPGALHRRPHEHAAEREICRKRSDSSGPMLDAVSEGPPHVHAGRGEAIPLASSKLGSKELIQGLLLPLLPEPQGFAAFQVADHADEFQLLTEVDLIHPISLSVALRRVAFQRSRYRRSMARTVVAAVPNGLATCRSEALSQANPTASSKSLLN